MLLTLEGYRRKEEWADEGRLELWEKEGRGDQKSIEREIEGVWGAEAKWGGGEEKPATETRTHCTKSYSGGTCFAFIFYEPAQFRAAAKE
ncbi:hypothetical protein EVAR_39247_1 [Eumeta japonica]|uniref:Uncharacterized protein n=1 Tax=Eumeta variegata TaxID=151549 RepID=A0A4C1XZI3_EUMVA|nr:hypothetical protein EVAR_39247_1 [Eumeta japonica]